MPIDSTNNTDRTRWRPELSDDHDTPRSTTRETPAARRHAGAGEDLFDRTVDRQPTTSDYLAFMTTLAAPRTATDAVSSASADAARDAAVQKKLDGVRDSFSGPYVVDGEQVTARPMFRMMTHVVPEKTMFEVEALAAKAGANGVAAHYGQCTPKDLVKTTQALINAGRLPAGPGDVSTRIRQMQWDYGIGIDCAGYSKQALLSTGAGAKAVHEAGDGGFRHLEKRAASFPVVSLANARPGDLITLDPGEGETYGHNVVVYSHIADGPRHVFEVDSSWGAGEHGSPEGGYRRDRWTYDESTKTWGYYEPHGNPREYVTSSIGPAGDKFHAVYRPR